MALQLNDTSYSGTYSSYFITQATYEMDTIAKGLVHVVGDIRKKHTIGRVDFKKPLRPNEATPTPDPDSNFTFDGRPLVPKNVSIYEEFNPRDFEDTQIAEQLKATIIDREVPQNLQSQLVQLVLNRAAEKYEDGLWMGSLDYAGAVDKDDPRYQIQYFDGFMKRFVNDSLVNDSSISPVTITTSNIATIMDDLLTQATTKAKGLVSSKNAKKVLKYSFSPKTANIYNQYLRSIQFKGLETTDGSLPRWSGYEVVEVAGMPDDTILFCRQTDEGGEKGSNLYAGMNSMGDWQLKLGKVANNSELYFIQGKFKWDVQYGWPEEIFLYTVLTAGDFTV